MDMKYFIDEMNRLNASFRGINEKGRIDRYFSKVKDLPNDAMTIICDHYLDTFRNSPLPLDFEKSANEWKKAFFDKNGYYYNSSADGNRVIENTVYELKCKKCNDTGFAWIKFEGINLWCFCMCSKGGNELNHSTLRLPRLDFEMLNLVSINEFPLQIFMPSTKENVNYMDLNMKAFEWKQDKLLSQKIWNEMK
jgi:hypothetical protein